jgi:hypothetical protein
MVNYITCGFRPQQIKATAQANVVAKLKKVPSFFDNILTDLAVGMNPGLIQDLKNMEMKAMVQVASFVVDCSSQKFKHWHIYRQEVGELSLPISKGRAMPERKGFRGSGKGEMDRIARSYDYVKNGVRPHPTLPFHKCKTPKQKLELVTNSDASPEIKVEFISDILAGRL